MKEKIKRTLMLLGLISFCFYISSFVTVAEEASFAGVRTLEFRMEQSDVQNFVNGGCSAFDFIVRSRAPGWLQYTLRNENRDVYVAFSFEFVSYEDYCIKMEELLQYAPSIVWLEENGFFLMENFNSLEQLNFLKQGLNESGCLIERTAEELFSNITLDIIMVNGKEYEIDGRVNIRPKEQKSIKFDEVEIITTGKKNGDFERTIVVEIHDTLGNTKEVKNTLKRMGRVAAVKVEDLTENSVKITADFEAYNSEELVQKTMVCLGVTSAIQETEEYVDDSTIRVRRTEYVDLDELLKEGGAFYYFYEFPFYYQNVIGKEDSPVIVTEESIETENESYVEFYYERGIQFDEIEIFSDFSDWSGKKHRSISLSKNIYSVQNYHKNVKEELSNKLKKGMMLDIYDEGGKRYYKISYSSYKTEEIEEFTKTILEGACTINKRESWIPFAKSTLEEKLVIDEILYDMASAKNVAVSYKLFPLSKIEDAENECVTIEENIITYRGGNSVLADINYKTINPLKCGLELFVLIFAVSSVLIVYTKIKQMRTKEGTEINGEKIMKEQYVETQVNTSKKIIFCPNCGNLTGEESKFCGMCGSVLNTQGEERLVVEYKKGKQKRKTKITILVILIALGMCIIGGLFLFKMVDFSDIFNPIRQKNISKEREDEEESDREYQGEEKNDMDVSDEYEESTDDEDSKQTGVLTKYEENLDNMLVTEKEKYVPLSRVGYALINYSDFTETLEMRDTYEYDEAGNLIKTESISIGDKSISKCGYEYIYEYDEEMNLIVKQYFYNEEISGEEYPDKESEEIISDNREDKYNKDGEIIESKSINPETGKVLSKTEYIYEYDDKGNIIKTNEFYDGEISCIVEYQYDNSGNVVESRHMFNDEGQWEHGYTYKHEYDSRGNLIKTMSYYENGDSSTTEYEYDSQDNMTKIIVYDAEEKEIQKYECIYGYITVSAENTYGQIDWWKRISY